VNNYKFLEELGEGSFGVVELAERLDDGKQFAIKILRKQELKR
jgi:serine/threonine protein kinase